MRLSSKQILFVSVTLGQITDIAGRTITVRDGVAVRSKQLDARGVCTSCLDPNQAPSTSVPASLSTLSQAEAQKKGHMLLSGPKTGKTWPSYTESYRLDNTKPPRGLERDSINWLEGPLKARKDQQFVVFSLYSKAKPSKTDQTKNPVTTVDNPTFDAKYSPDGIVIDLMDKKFDYNKVKIPTSELMAQGIVHTKTKPTYVFMKKIGNSDTRGFIWDAITEKNGGDKTKAAKAEWTLSSTSKDALEKKWFETLIGSDNGRPVQQLCNYYPKLVEGKTVTSIYIKGDAQDKILFILGNKTS